MLMIIITIALGYLVFNYCPFGKEVIAIIALLFLLKLLGFISFPLVIL